MAYSPNNLSVLAYANGHTQWHYTTPDTMADVGAIGYFDAASDMLRAGDMLMVNVEDDRDTASGCILLVTRNVVGKVGVARLVASPLIPDDEVTDAAA